MQSFSHHASPRVHRSDRRGRKRVTLTVNAQVARRGKIEKRATFDISETGLRVATDAFEVSSIVKVFVPIPRDQKVRMCFVRAEVVWSAKGSCGLRFIDPSLDAVQQVREYVLSKLAPTA